MVIMVASAVIIILSSPYMDLSHESAIPVDTDIAIENQMENISAWFSDIFAEIKESSTNISKNKWIFVLAGLLCLLTASFILRNFVVALCCATLGTFLIYVGMTLLLLYKGSEPLSMMWDKCSLFAAVFAAMATFGTSIQMLFCRSKTTAKNTAKKKYETNKQEK